MDGIQGDQEFLHKLLGLKRARVKQTHIYIYISGSWHASRKQCCHYCAAVRSLGAEEPISMLFTAHGDQAAHRSTLHGSHALSLTKCIL